MSNDILVIIIAILGGYVSMNYIVDRWQYLFGVGVGLVIGVIGHVGRYWGQ